MKDAIPRISALMPPYLTSCRPLSRTSILPLCSSTMRPLSVWSLRQRCAHTQRFLMNRVYTIPLSTLNPLRMGTYHGSRSPYRELFRGFKRQQDGLNGPWCPWRVVMDQLCNFSRLRESFPHTFLRQRQRCVSASPSLSLSRHLLMYTCMSIDSE